MIDLLKFQKPQRYIGNELNVIKKSHSKKISFCLCYPDLYEIGMDNLGLRIIYGILNSYSDLVCERAFLPGPDLLDYLKKEEKPLFSLETKTPLSDFDLVGFNFGYELNYLNFLEMLTTAKIPLKSSARKDTIVIGGAVANPQPLATFVDLFCLGEFEAVAKKLIQILRKYKNKFDRLKTLSQVEGIYVPAFYTSSFQENSYQMIKKYPKANLPIKRVKVKNLDNNFFPTKWITPHTKLIQDRVAVEIARGCPNNCNFCQAKSIYHPYREKKVKTIVNTIKAVYKNTGYESFSLLCLSASNYSKIDKLITALIPFAEKNKITINFPSLRIGKKIEPIYKKMLAIQKTALTVAIEAGSKSLRKKLNKNIDLDKLFELARPLSNLGLRTIKVYFMYGFSDEKREDLLAIGDLIKDLLKRTSLKINVSINLFIPKPSSTWEKMPLCQMRQAELKKKIILDNIPRTKRIKLSSAQIEKNLIEAIISRGNIELGSTLLKINKLRKELQEKDQLFSWPVWKEALEKTNVDWQKYIKSETKNFPWSFIE
ncbi:MAG: TIGR03960 family B12-binding radical SAM protein [Candidatus Omnitrophica bacterium]|nr:TIGR03960 family B12-binding radical SAM protein [Candidatus Omnitrophota bacterium]